MVNMKHFVVGLGVCVGLAAGAQQPPAFVTQEDAFEETCDGAFWHDFSMTHLPYISLFRIRKLIYLLFPDTTIFVTIPYFHPIILFKKMQRR